MKKLEVNTIEKVNNENEDNFPDLSEISLIVRFTLKRKIKKSTKFNL